MRNKVIAIVASEPVGWPESPMYGLFQNVQAKLLAQEGFRVIIISPCGRSLKYGLNFRKDQLENYQDIKLLRNSTPNLLRFNKKLESLNYVFVGLCLMILNRKILRDVDIYHFHNIYNGGVLLTVARRMGLLNHAEIFLTEHSSFVHNDGGSDIVKRFVLNTKSLSVSGVSHSIKAVLEKYINPVFLLHNPVDILFDECPVFKDRLDQICIVGALEEIKNHKLLLNSLKLIEEPLKVVVIGEGSLREELIRIAVTLPKNIDTIFLGYQDPVTIRDVMRVSKSVISVSRSETFGVVLIESLSQGTPIISTINGGSMDIITNEVGFLCDFDEACIAEAILKTLRQGTFDYVKIRNYYEKKFGQRAYLMNVIRYYGV